MRDVKIHGKIKSVENSPRTLSADAYRESLEARKTLALMNLHEGLAERAIRERSGSLRTEYAGRYRELIGVSPEQRAEFRAALERVRDGGGMGVQDVIDLLRLRSQAKGFGSGAGGDEPPFA